MPIWQDATVNTSTGVIDLDGGPDAVRVLAPGFVLTGNEARVGFGVQIIMGGASDPLAPDAPVLTWDEDEIDTTPNFSVDLPSGNGEPLDAQEDDVLRVRYRPSGGDWSDYLEDTLDAGEIAGEPITVTGVDPLANGNYDFQARLERGSVLGEWGDTESVTVAASTTAGEAIGLLLVLTKAA